MGDRIKCQAGVRTTLKFAFGLYERVYCSTYEDTLTQSMTQGNSGYFGIFLAGKDIKNICGTRNSIVICKEVWPH